MSNNQFIHTPLTLKELPQPIFYQLRSMPENTVYPPHQHQWGEFVYSFSGVLELQAEGREFRVPPSFGLWHPPNTEHRGGNRQASFHCSFYIDHTLATQRKLPEKTCSLMINPMVRAMLNHLRLNPPQAPYSLEESKLLDVILDQLVIAPSAGSYLPDSNDPLLFKALRYLKENPSDNCSLKTLATQLGTSERTLARKAQLELGMALSEWRQRLKVMRAILMLQEGASVENIALDLGYSTASSFIVMFRRLLDTTPDEYRRNCC